MKTLDFSPDLKLPVDVVTQKLAFLGVSGSGKSYGAGKLVELLSAASAPFAIVDNVGNWYGLRLAKDGKSSGIAIPILGGKHGDVPLAPEHGRLVAETLCRTGASVVIDVSDFTGGEARRFVTDFATAMLRGHKAQPAPRLILWEECHQFVPQFVKGDVAVMVGAVERLVKTGRNYGVGTVLISQRPAAVNKDVLSQVETVFAFRTPGAQDRKALKEWMIAQQVESELDLLTPLPSLPTGDCFVWSPHWLGRFGRIRVEPKWTFDSTATPKLTGSGKLAKAAALTPIDLEAFKSTMGVAIEEAQKNDPAVLRRRIVELERDLRTVQREKAAPERPRVTRVAYLMPPAAARISEKLSGELGGVRQKLQEAQVAVTAVESWLRRIEPSVRQIAALAKDHPSKAALPPPAANGVVAVPQGYKVTVPHDLGDRSGSAPESVTPARQRLLNALAWLDSAGLHPATKTRLALVAKVSSTSGGFANNLGALRSANLIDYPGPGLVALTDAGRKLAAIPTAPLTAEELQRAVYQLVPPARAKIVEALVAAYPADMAKDDLAQRIDVSATSGGFANNLGALRTLGLIDYPAPGKVRAADVLFLERA